MARHAAGMNLELTILANALFDLVALGAFALLTSRRPRAQRLRLLYVRRAPRR